MLDELMLRLTGERLWRYWEEYIRKPLNLDFYIGLPESEWNRVATLYPGKMDMSNMGTPFYLEYMNKGTPRKPCVQYSDRAEQCAADEYAGSVGVRSSGLWRRGFRPRHGAVLPGLPGAG